MPERLLFTQVFRENEAAVNPGTGPSSSEQGAGFADPVQI
jgi:hypothetical protein